MLETPHFIVGAAIVTKIPNPIISIPLAFGSHFILDMVPHWNPHINTELKKNGKVSGSSKFIIAADVALAIGSGLFMSNVSGTNLYLVYAGGLAAMMPDIVEAPYFFLGWKHKILKSWLKFQKAIQTDVSVVPGVLTQIVTIIAAVWWVFN